MTNDVIDLLAVRERRGGPSALETRLRMSIAALARARSALGRCSICATMISPDMGCYVDLEHGQITCVDCNKK